MTVDLTVHWDMEFLDRTENKDPRSGAPQIYGLLLHETASKSKDPRSTLNWNLHKVDPASGQDVYSSYNAMTDRYGKTWGYVSSAKFVAWGAGVSTWKLPNGIVLINYQLNLHLIQYELDGPNDGTPCTEEQLNEGARVLIHYSRMYNFPLDPGYIPMHKQVAPGRKHDPEGTTNVLLIERAKAMLGATC